MPVQTNRIQVMSKIPDTKPPAAKTAAKTDDKPGSKSGGKSGTYEKEGVGQ